MYGNSRIPDKIIEITLLQINGAMKKSVLVTSTKASDENKTHTHTHTINDDYCNFVLVKLSAQRQWQKMHILIGAHHAQASNS